MSITEMYPDTQPGVAAFQSPAAAVAEELASLVAGLDMDGLGGEEAAELTLAFARIERLGAAAKTLAAGRVATSGYWRLAGFDTAQRWLAHVTKDNPWEAARAIETAEHLAEQELAQTRRAFLSGELTATQANEIATAAMRSPAEQARLLAVAAAETMGRLRFECRKVRLADRPPPEPKTKAEDTAGEMSFGHREVGGDMSELFVRMPTSWLVLVLAAVRHQCDAVFAKARAEGRDYPHQAYMVEALVTLLLIGGIDAPAGPFDDAEGAAAEGGEAAEGPFDDADGDDADGDDADGDDADAGATGPGAGSTDNDLLHDQLLAILRGEPPPQRPPRARRWARRGRCGCGGRVVPAARILVRIDHSALMRGHAQGDELCDISGVGPVSVSTVPRPSSPKARRSPASPTWDAEPPRPWWRPCSSPTRGAPTPPVTTTASSRSTTAWAMPTWAAPAPTSSTCCAATATGSRPTPTGNWWPVGAGAAWSPPGTPIMVPPPPGGGGGRSRRRGPAEQVAGRAAAAAPRATTRPEPPRGAAPSSTTVTRQLLEN